MMSLLCPDHQEDDFLFSKKFIHMDGSNDMFKDKVVTRCRTFRASIDFGEERNLNFTEAVDMLPSISMPSSYLNYRNSVSKRTVCITWR